MSRSQALRVGLMSEREDAVREMFLDFFTKALGLR
jgi:hypothetical protein